MSSVATKKVECNCYCTLRTGQVDPECEFCKGKGKRRHPLLKRTRWYDICPKCGFKSRVENDLQDFDVLGSDQDCVFCTQCSQEIAL